MQLQLIVIKPSSLETQVDLVSGLIAEFTLFDRSKVVLRLPIYTSACACPRVYTPDSNEILVSFQLFASHNDASLLSNAVDTVAR